MASPEVKTGEVIPEWQATMELSGLDFEDSLTLNVLSRLTNITRTTLWQYARGIGTPSPDQQKRIINVLEPLIKARERKIQLQDSSGETIIIREYWPHDET